MDFDGFLRQICPVLDLEWRKYRRRSARHRVERRMTELGIEGGYRHYLEYLRDNRQEADDLADIMRVTVSRFFRDRKCWSQMVEDVLPKLLAENICGSVFHVWSAGCCGGEEPYTMAMVWLQSLQMHFPEFAIDILATDIDGPSLDRACLGAYEHASLREVPPEIVASLFRRKAGRWLVDQRVKNLVHFLSHNLMEDPTPAEIDLVLCRNLVFTYYRGDRQSGATRRLYDAMRPGGVLMIGKSETLDPTLQQLFEPWPGVGCAYRKR